MNNEFGISDLQIKLMANKLGYPGGLSEQELADIKVGLIGEIFKKREELVYPVIKYALELRLKKNKGVVRTRCCEKDAAKIRCCDKNED
jgi:hypothetical protein